MNKPKIILFGTGEKEPNKGGTGIGKILENIKSGKIQAQVAAIITNHENGGVANIAQKYSIPIKVIENFPKRDKPGKYGKNSEKKTKFSKESKKEIKKIYKDILKEYQPDYIFMSGRLKYILGLPIHQTINIHPGPTKAPYGGKGMYGDNIHKKIWQDYEAGKIKRTCITIHYITPKIDDGPIIAQIPVKLNKCHSWEDVKKAVKKVEHKYQWQITKKIIEGKIKRSGEKGDLVEFPKWYRWKKPLDLTKSIQRLL